ncbi:MAG: HIT family protein [Phycicoccus sp.]
MTADSCVFCSIVAGDAPARLVDRSDDCLVIVPRDPVVPGHVLIIPRVHVADFTADSAVTARVARDAANWAASWPGPWNLITSAGTEATQTVFHLHVHLIPRRGGDRLLLPWSAQQASPVWASAAVGLAVGDGGGIKVYNDEDRRYALSPEEAHAAGLALLAGAYRQQQHGGVTT